MDGIILEVSEITKLNIEKVQKTLDLLLNDCSVPFIARYRKEVTGGLDEIQIRDIRDQYEHLYLLNERKTTILRSISEQGKLTPELESCIKATKKRSELEDLYVPFKPKKRTRGQMALERGLDKVAEKVLTQSNDINLLQFFEESVGSHDELKTIENVIQGVKDYIAEHISEIANIRSYLREWGLENSMIRAVVAEKFKDEKTKYNNYYDFSESIKTITPHRIMALRRAEKEEILKVSFEYENEIVLKHMQDTIIKTDAPEEIKNFLSDCIADAFNRLLSPHLETEMRLETKLFAETEAIRVFEKNLKHLLLLPPIHKRTVMGIDPGFRTGSKVVVVDKTGKLLAYSTIHPQFKEGREHLKNKSASDILLKYIKENGVSLIAIGNGTAGREVEAFIEQVLSNHKDLTIRTVMVNEAGASVYSASDVAREEFPNLDITIRGAVSIARRLQDPLSELVKIDPKSLGVGQYQHDVNQNKLKKQLSEVVESCVNYVGVNLNTASAYLLSFVSGIKPHLAKAIVQYRDENGEFKNRSDLMNISGFGPKTFEQAAGFLRVPGAENPLDNTAVHPETYELVQKMAEALTLKITDFVGQKEALAKVKATDFVTDTLGLPTVQDVLKELHKPGRDPREDGARHAYNREVRKFDQLEEGQTLTGTVTNVSNFGAFVDIGVHQDGLIHVSELAHQFISDITKFVSVGDTIQVKVIGLDKERKRISLSKKACEAKPEYSPAPKQTFEKPKAYPKNQEKKQYRSGGHNPKTHSEPTSSLGDLLSKYTNNRV